jgi:histidine triad (HIT) family protein
MSNKMSDKMSEKVSDSECVFCKITDDKIPATIVYRDDDVMAFKDLTPRAPLHLLVIPLRHIATLTQARPEDAEIFGKLMVTAARLAIEAGYGTSGFRVVLNAGPDAGQSVLHVHLHVLGGRALAWPPG